MGMSVEDRLILGAGFAMNQLGELKRLEGIVEKERLRLADKMRRHLDAIEAIKKDMVALVANEAESVSQVNELCDIIRKLNEVLDYERNVGACAN